jgi:hypothetical protein
MAPAHIAGIPAEEAAPSFEPNAEENRSFDQMLGYLTQDGMPDVDGLRGGELNLDDQGNEYPSFEWGADQTVFHPQIDPSGKILDPDHSKGGVAEQLADGNGGFGGELLARLQGLPATTSPTSIAPS